MISQCGITIFIFGNKKDNKDEIIEADGVIREFEISRDNNNICIPIGVTGHATNTIYAMIASEPERYFEEPNYFLALINKLADPNTTFQNALKEIDKLLKHLMK